MVDEDEAEGEFDRLCDGFSESPVLVPLVEVAVVVDCDDDGSQVGYVKLLLDVSCDEVPLTVEDEGSLLCEVVVVSVLSEDENEEDVSRGEAVEVSVTVVCGEVVGTAEDEEGEGKLSEDVVLIELVPLGCGREELSGGTT